MASKSGIPPVILSLQSWFRADLMCWKDSRPASTKAFWELLGPIQWAMNYSGSISLAPRCVSGLPAGTRAADIDSLLIRGEREELQMLWIISQCPHRRTADWTRDTWKSTGHWTRLCFSIDSGSRYSRIDIWGAFPCMMWRKTDNSAKNSSETFIFNFTMVVCSKYGVVSVKMKPQKDNQNRNAV